MEPIFCLFVGRAPLRLHSLRKLWVPGLGFKRWFAAQATTYEKRLGWIFWTWNAELGDYRWSYKGLSLPPVLPFGSCKQMCG